ncbi:MAG: hypothetical protein ACQEQY_02630 [Halobacteriota archaeon]
MDERHTQLLGVVAAVGGVLLAVSAIPPGWYGVPALDSYVFDPGLGSPLWIHRSVMPALSVLGVLGLFLGLLGLLRRDWASAGRLRRWSGVAALLGLGGLTVTTPILAFGTFGDAGTNTVLALVGVVLGGVSVLVLTIALVFLGLGYIRTTRPLLGYVLGGVVVVLPLVVYVVPDAMATFAASLPVALAAAVLGHDLYHRPDPLPRYVGTDAE